MLRKRLEITGFPILEWILIFELVFISSMTNCCDRLQFPIVLYVFYAKVVMVSLVIRCVNYLVFELFGAMYIIYITAAKKFLWDS